MDEIMRILRSFYRVNLSMPLFFPFLACSWWVRAWCGAFRLFLSQPPDPCIWSCNILCRQMRTDAIFPGLRWGFDRLHRLIILSNKLWVKKRAPWSKIPVHRKSNLHYGQPSKLKIISAFEICNFPFWFMLASATVADQWLCCHDLLKCFCIRLSSNNLMNQVRD